MTRLKGSERRMQILECATKIFATRGLEGARTREIAEACGINEALLYKHFKSKQDIFIEVMQYLHSKLVKIWQEAVEAAPDGRSALLLAMDLKVSDLADNPEICANLIHGLASATSDEEIRGIVTGWFIGYREFLDKVIRRGIEDGSLRKDIDPEAVSYCLRGIGWMNIIMHAIDLEEPAASGDPKQPYDEIMEFLSGHKK